MLSREEMVQALEEWNAAWNNHDLNGVMQLFHDEVLFENWTGGKARGKEALRKAWERTAGFDQVELGLTDEQIAAETQRCLNCDARQFEVVLNTEYCKECGYCAEVCDMHVFGPADYFNAKGYRPEEVKTSKWCCGCFKCYFACPDFAIDIKEVTG